MVDKNWSTIGFQGKDPSTDFRGGGLLALKQLSYFVNNDYDRAQDVYDTATNKEKWYFFAAAGINITGKLIELIEVSFE